MMLYIPETKNYLPVNQPILAIIKNILIFFR